jgi:hypothetical protein
MAFEKRQDDVDLDSLLDDPLKPRRIRCPKCGWQPTRHHRWWCSCHHSWNTFDTGGVCPACSKQWIDTACHACHKWSKHVDWYAE